MCIIRSFVSTYIFYCIVCKNRERHQTIERQQHGMMGDDKIVVEQFHFVSGQSVRPMWCGVCLWRVPQSIFYFQTKTRQQLHQMTCLSMAKPQSVALCASHLLENLWSSDIRFYSLLGVWGSLYCCRPCFGMCDMKWKTLPPTVCLKLKLASTKHKMNIQ